MGGGGHIDPCDRENVIIDVQCVFHVHHLFTYIVHKINIIITLYNYKVYLIIIV